jgi:hypothetical protein
MTLLQMYPEYKVARRFLSVEAFIDLYPGVTDIELDALSHIYEKESHDRHA